MDKGAIRKFAITARKKLLATVKQRAFELGITEKEIKEPEMFEDGFYINDHFFKKQEIEQRDLLLKKMEQTSFEHVMDEVAYTWFNRFIAIRFMEINDYLPTGIRMFSSLDAGKTEPDALTEVELLIDELELDQHYIYELQDTRDNNTLFKYILIQQCNKLGEMMPLVFEEITGYTKLLLPDYLLTESSVLHDLITMIKEEDWTKEVEIVGWLYQYYNAEKKDEVFADLRKNIKIGKDDIPAATQLFTPRWIVQYMVDNSLGRLWIESHQDDCLHKKLPYYLECAEQPEDVVKELARITNNHIDPETITFLDPSMGSGHVLVYAFEVLYEIYLSQGYRNRDIPKLILENNLYGLEIDDRATQLAYFALMMKGRQHNSRMFDSLVKLNVHAITESNDITTEDVEIFSGEDENLRAGLETLIETFQDAKIFGSIIEVPEIELSRLREQVTNLKEQDHTDLFVLEFTEYSLPIIERLIDQAELLMKKYDIVVTNPPYMGRKGMNLELAKYVRKHYKDSSADLFAVFMERIDRFTKKEGFFATVTMQSWMFLSSFEKFRNNLIENYSIVTLTHMANMVMGIAFGTAATILRKRINNYKGTFQYIEYEDIENDRPYTFPITKNRYATISGDSFKDIPGSPIAYWASPQIQNTFRENPKLNNFADVKKGSFTGNNNLFLKFWFEVVFCRIGFNTSSRIETVGFDKKWYPYNKGGSYRKWYGNNEYVINWENDGQELQNYKKFGMRNPKYFFKEGITWSSLTSGNVSFRYSPQGYLFDSKGPMIFPKKGYSAYDFLSIINTKISSELLALMAPTLDFNPTPVGNIPIKKMDIKKFNIKCNKYTHENISLSKSDWDSFETSWDFKIHPLIEFKQDATKLADAFHNWKKEAEQRFETLKTNEEELNRIFIDLYGLQDELTPEVEDKDVTVSRADQERDVKSFLSYLVGIMFGRYSLDEEGLVFAGGEFDFTNYQTFKADKENIIPITDEMYFEDDIVGRVIELVKVIFGEEFIEDNLAFIADTLTRRRNETARERIRRYFLKEFYKDHVRTYQKRPIYWLIESGRNDGFKALVYLHRYQSDLLSRVRTQYLHAQLKKYEDEIKRMNMTMESDVSQAEKARARKTKEKVEKQIIECQSYDQVIAHMAHLQIELDLDDGVKINYEKFQGISVPQGEGKPPVKANIFAKI